MGRDKQNENRDGQWTKWIKSHSELEAWKALSFAARDAYLNLRVRCFAETAQKRPKVANNNGRVFRSPRDLAKDMGCSPKTAMAALADLQAKGWVIATEVGHLGVGGKGKTCQFRLTMLPMGSGQNYKAPTCEPKRWSTGNDFDILCYSGYLPKPRNGRAANFKTKAPHPI